MHLDDELVARFVAGALDPTAREQVEAEVARCMQCAVLVAAVARDHVPEERYVLGAVIARGGMGTIVAAFDRRLGRDVAIKRLDSFSPRARVRFDREIEITSALQHPNIVPIYDAGELTDGRAFYAMRHVAGRDLGVAIETASTLEDRLGLVAPITSAIDAVAYAHERGVVHRDLKPLNILVGPFGETVVIDWGLAKVGGEPSLEPASNDDDDWDATRDGAILGTPRYMAPEQARGEPATARADVYALGAVLYHALAGVSPGDLGSARDTIEQRARGESVPLAQRAPSVPRDLVAIVERAMAYAPEARYATARELAADLRRFQTGQLVLAHRYTRPDHVRRFVRRHRVPLVVASVALVVTAVENLDVQARLVSSCHHARRADGSAGDETEDLADPCGREDPLHRDLPGQAVVILMS
jgi:eukaryotic-like serine/threonine-protein kinase